MTSLGSTPLSCDPEAAPSSTVNEPSGTLNSVDPVASAWLQLASMDRQSPDFLPLLSSLVGKRHHPSTVRLGGNDAEITLGALVEVSRSPAKRWNHRIMSNVVSFSRYSEEVKSPLNTNVIPAALCGRLHTTPVKFPSVIGFGLVPSAWKASWLPMAVHQRSGKGG